MSNPTTKSFNSIKELISHFQEKYSSKHCGTFGRYPSSIIFFDNIHDYCAFLDTVPWEKSNLSERVGSDLSLKCFKMDQWIDDAISNSKENPLVLATIGECIRFCRKKGGLEDSFIFQKILLAENSKLIVPFCEWQDLYSSFSDGFIHQKEHRATTYFITSSSDKKINECKVILDNTSKIPSEDNQVVIKTIREWLELWEGGLISSLTSLLITNRDINKSLHERPLHTPNCVTNYIDNEIQYINFRFGISSSSFTLEPTNEIWEVIYKIIYLEQDNCSWDKIIKKVLGQTYDFENQYLTLWNYQVHNGRIKRWFWLNEAKKNVHPLKFLNTLIQEIIDPEKLFDEIYLSALKSDFTDKNLFAERREILSLIHKPHFLSDQHTLESNYKKMVDNFAGDVDQILLRSSGIFEYEYIHILNSVISILKNNPSNPIINEILPKIWPTLFYYIQPILHELTDDINLQLDNFDIFSDQYRAHYLKDKILFDKPSNFLKKFFEQQYLPKWTDIVSHINVGHIRSNQHQAIHSELSGNDFIFLDGIGYEWQSVICDLFMEKGWQIFSNEILVSTLPSITEVFPLKDNAIEKFSSFDQIIHSPYTYPYSIVTELREIENIVNQIHDKNHGRNKKLFLISDHGSTVFARQAIYLNLKDVQYQHGGRCSIIDASSKSKYANNSDVFVHSHNQITYLLSLTYKSLSNKVPKGEAHGGGLPEEILSCFICLLPPNCDISTISQIVITSDKEEYSPLDENLILYIENKDLTYVEVFRIVINGGKKFEPNPQWINNNRITIPLSILRDYGIIVGSNTLLLSLDQEMTSLNFNYASGSSDTGFNDLFS